MLIYTPSLYNSSPTIPPLHFGHRAIWCWLGLS